MIDSGLPTQELKMTIFFGLSGRENLAGAADKKTPGVHPARRS